jgi:DNA-directed RNA polymerase beta subunit
LKNHSNGRITFGKIKEIVEAPDLLNIQLESWENFLQADLSPARRKNKGLQAVFKMNFPIADARENYLLEFIEYYVEKPKYSVPESEASRMLFRSKQSCSFRRKRKTGQALSIQSIKTSISATCRR